MLREIVEGLVITTADIDNNLKKILKEEDVSIVDFIDYVNKDKGFTPKELKKSKYYDLVQDFKDK